GDNIAYAMKSVVVDPSYYDWEDDVHPDRSYGCTVIYETHVGGFTRHPSSGIPTELRGTYAGLIRKIPYLKSLGITAIELMPVQQFDPQDAPRGLTNYWGYAPVAFFAPHHGYASGKSPVSTVVEFRDMVKALHRAGIEVILDVVFNHTAENDETGPTLSLRGFENRAYYIRNPDGRTYADYTGTGNTIKANHSIVRRMIRECLRRWVSEMHVDGFRFDLASVMARDEKGTPMMNPPILWDIESDPVLAGTKIIAEAWDAAGLYQVGDFIGYRWAEWNGHFRDDVRRFIKGDNDTVHSLAARINASPDVYTQPDREPNRSINFVSCHDGFTLNDLVSYNRKHNFINGEENTDGANINYSWNCGIEGPTNNAAIERLRIRQIKNLLVVLFISQGTPMLLMGDEIRRTQTGNNNAYCQDNELSWMNWENTERHDEVLRFTQQIIAFTQNLAIFRQERFWALGHKEVPPHVVWHGVRLREPDWAEYSHSLAMVLHAPEENEKLYVALNAYWQPLTFELPPLPQGMQWHLIVDTGNEMPDDFRPGELAPIIEASTYTVMDRSSIILQAR
ncbi:MAG: alpha-amylase family glycosyl hydrolase, partial [Anaerolineae bacterium]|nr:alpha-amylase family glycosyl hydrolase [Anaerolineae bacterium]